MHADDQQPDRRPVAGMVAVLSAITVWGGVSVIARFVERIDGLALGFHRLWIGSVITVTAFYATGRRLHWATVRKSMIGGIAFGADIVLFFSALKHTTVANATVVCALQPALVLLIAGPMFGERINARIVTCSAAAMAGVAIVVYGSSGAPVWSVTGDLLAIGALFAWTWYFVASKQVRSQLAPFEYLTAAMIVATVAVTPVALLSGQRLDPGPAGDWVWIVVLAIGAGGVGHLLLNWAHAHLDLSVMSLLTLAIPVVGVISAAIFLDEPVGGVQILGMVVVIAALVPIARETAGEAPAPEPALEPAASP